MAKRAKNASLAISLVAIDASGNVLSNDVFTTTAAGPVAKFSGTYSNPDGAAMVSVIYPAFTNGDGTEAVPWSCAKKVLFDMKLGKQFINISTYGPHFQDMNADPAFLSQAVVMRGKISDMSAFLSGTALTTLKNTCYIVKTTVTLPPTVSAVSEVSLKTSSSSITAHGWTVLDDRFMSYYGGTSAEELRKIRTRLDGFVPASDRTVTAWMIGYGADRFEVKSGETLTMSVITDDGYFSRDKPLASDIIFEPGKIYRLTVDMTK